MNFIKLKQINFQPKLLQGSNVNINGNLFSKIQTWSTLKLTLQMTKSMIQCFNTANKRPNFLQGRQSFINQNPFHQPQLPLNQKQLLSKRYLFQSKKTQELLDKATTARNNGDYNMAKIYTKVQTVCIMLSLVIPFILFVLKT